MMWDEGTFVDNTLGAFLRFISNMWETNPWLVAVLFIAVLVGIKKFLLKPKKPVPKMPVRPEFSPDEWKEEMTYISLEMITPYCYELFRGKTKNQSWEVSYKEYCDFEGALSVLGDIWGEFDCRFGSMDQCQVDRDLLEPVYEWFETLLWISKEHIEDLKKEGIISENDETIQFAMGKYSISNSVSFFHIDHCLVALGYMDAIGVKKKQYDIETAVNRFQMAQMLTRSSHATLALRNLEKWRRKKQ